MDFFFFGGGGVGWGQCSIRAQAKLAQYPGPELKGNTSLEGKKLPTSENTTAANLFLLQGKKVEVKR